MIPRAAVREITAKAVKEVIPEKRIFSSFDAKNPLGGQPFIVIKWGSIDPIFGKHGKLTFELWIYDPQPTYVRIDKLSDLCIKEFMKTEQYVGKDKVRLPITLYNGSSDDLFDDVFECTLKRISFLIPNN